MRIAGLGNRTYLLDKIKYWPNEIEILEKASDIREDHDLVFCLGHYKLIKSKYFNRPKFGTIVLHATDLPKGRGWAPVNWALVRGDDRIHVTSFKIDEGCDTGPYHMKSFCMIEPTDTIITAYEKVEEEFVRHIKSIVCEAQEAGMVTFYEQKGESTWNPKRTPADAELDPDKTLREQWNLIRSCHNEDYPAFIKLHGKKIYLRYEVADE